MTTIQTVLLSAGVTLLLYLPVWLPLLVDAALAVVREIVWTLVPSRRPPPPSVIMAQLGRDMVAATIAAARSSS